jgi:hypothetical protein
MMTDGADIQAGLKLDADQNGVYAPVEIGVAVDIPLLRRVRQHTWQSTTAERTRPPKSVI